MLAFFDCSYAKTTAQLSLISAGGFEFGCEPAEFDLQDQAAGVYAVLLCYMFLGVHEFPNLQLVQKAAQ